MKPDKVESGHTHALFTAAPSVANGASPELLAGRELEILEPLAAAPLPTEAEFYGQYSWCLNAVPTIREVVEHLSEELQKVERLPGGWQQSELITNIYLLSCTLTDTVDDYLAGATYDFSRVARVVPWVRPAIRATEIVLAVARRSRTTSLFRLQRWRQRWAAAVMEFLMQSLAGRPERRTLLQHCHHLAKLVPVRLPAGLRNRRPRIPAFFRSRDFAPLDCLELGRQFLLASWESNRPVIVVGLRTAGSFLAPLLCGFLKTKLQGSQWVAIRPKQGLAGHERAALCEAARAKAKALIIDESIHSGRTLAHAVELLRHSGFADEDVVVLNPVDPAFPRWREARDLQSLANVSFVALDPWQRSKQRFLDSGAVEHRLNEYFMARGYAQATVVASPEVEQQNQEWKRTPARVDIRLKRLYKVRLERATGCAEFRFVLAKSVGWGWLGYHAFVVGHKLARFVPTVLGLRDGILYTEWIPATWQMPVEACDREQLVTSLASYVAARSQCLQLTSDPTPDMARQGRLKGLSTLASALSRAGNFRIAAAVQRSRIQRELSRPGSVMPVLTDSKMSREEWLLTDSKLLKVDFEHHGQGKNELGITDPAFDVAGAIYHFGLSESESAQLVHDYIKDGGDASVSQRLFWNKLLTGLWAQNLATLGLKSSRLFERRDEFHLDYVSSWNFLVLETLRECGKLCQKPAEIKWRSSLVVTDIDGVLDRMVFGFPSTTAAGIQAISLLHAHGFPIVANTARSLPEVKEYCRAYHFAGGMAEYGAVIWDAISRRELVLTSQESQDQLAGVHHALNQIPGVFLNDDYRYSLRAFTYQGERTAPLPPLLVQDVLASRKADRLLVHHTGLDTAILARETDKGVGMLSLLAMAGLKEPEVFAIGDSEPDLAMFRVARRSFAPGNVSCAREAKLLGTHIAKAHYQSGLLQIARKIVHPDGENCDRCCEIEEDWRRHKGLFISLLELADDRSPFQLVKSVLSPSLWSVFRQ